MQQLKASFARRPRLTRVVLLGYLVFCGCFLFPLGSARFPLTLSKAWLLALSYGMLAAGLAVLWGKGRAVLVYACSLGLTAAGLLCRFVLEFGEASNLYNFTMGNVVCYLAVVPLYLLLCYFVALHYLHAPSEK